MEYPTARVKLRGGGIDRLVRVVVAPKLPIPVLLGQDVAREELPVLPFAGEELPVLLSAGEELPVLPFAGEERAAGRSVLPSAGQKLPVLPSVVTSVDMLLESIEACM